MTNIVTMLCVRVSYSLGYNSPVMEIINKRAKSSYEIIDTYIAGIKLKGEEVKSLRLGHATFAGAYVTEKSGELFLVNLSISRYKKSGNTEYEPKRTRKLLLKKSEITKIRIQLGDKGRTVIPLKIFMNKNKFKVEVAVAKGKSKIQKKQSLKEKQLKRDTERQLKDIGF